MNVTEVTRSAALGAIAAVLIAGGISMALAPDTVRQAAASPSSFVPFGERHDNEPDSGDDREGDDAEPSPTSTPENAQSAGNASFSTPTTAAQADDARPGPETATATPALATPVDATPAAATPDTPTPAETAVLTATPEPTATPTEVPTLVPGPDDLAPAPTLTVVPVDPCVFVDCEEPGPVATIEVPTLKPAVNDALPVLTPVLVPRPALDDVLGR